jgi:hypothetical protein
MGRIKVLSQTKLFRQRLPRKLDSIAENYCISSSNHRVASKESSAFVT